MSKQNPGQWDCVGKPDAAYLGVLDGGMQRIQGATSQFATTNIPAGAPGMHGMPGAQPMQYNRNAASQPMQTQEDSVSFDNIEDDMMYRMARALYQSNMPTDRIEFENGRQLELYEQDLAILEIKQGRTNSHVDIETYPSFRALLSVWDELRNSAGY